MKINKQVLQELNQDVIMVEEVIDKVMIELCKSVICISDMQEFP